MLHFLTHPDQIKASAALAVAAGASMISQLRPADPSAFGYIIQGGSFALVVAIFGWLAMKWWPQHRKDSQAQVQFLMETLFKSHEAQIQALASEHARYHQQLDGLNAALRENTEMLRSLREDQKAVLKKVEGEA